MIDRHLTHFFNRPVVELKDGNDLSESSRVAYAIRSTWENEPEHFQALWDEVMNNRDVGNIEALILGAWTEEMFEVSTSYLVNLLVGAATQLTGLKALFFPDITYEESEISWLTQSDVTPVLDAYPQLEALWLRGGNDLSFSRTRHSHLKKLVIQTGGLAAQTVREICNLNLPALEHLELWLGSEGYGGDAQTQDLTPILSGTRFPNLSYLGLRNSEFANDIVHALAGAPVLEQLKTLDLSMGNMTDEGASHLINNEAFQVLERFDLSDNFLSAPLKQPLLSALPNLHFGDQKTADHDFLYCTVSE